MGQVTSAKNKNKYILGVFHEAKPSLVRDNHTQPSENCCIEKIKGIIANTLREGAFALIIDIVPILASIILAPKLAVAEKHIKAIYSCSVIWSLDKSKPFDSSLEIICL